MTTIGLVEAFVWELFKTGETALFTEEARITLREEPLAMAELIFATDWVLFKVLWLINEVDKSEDSLTEAEGGNTMELMTNRC